MSDGDLVQGVVHPNLEFDRVQGLRDLVLDPVLVRKHGQGPVLVLVHRRVIMLDITQA